MKQAQRKRVPYSADTPASLADQKHRDVFIDVLHEVHRPSVVEQLDLVDLDPRSYRDLVYRRPDCDALINLPDDAVADGIHESHARQHVSLDPHARRR